MRLYWDSHALFLIGVSEPARRLLEEARDARHQLLTSAWAVTAARSNFGRDTQVDIDDWKASLQHFQVVQDHK